MRRGAGESQAIPLGRFLASDFGKDEELLGPLFLENSIGMIFGPRGCGKSLLTLYISYAIAAGKNLPPWGAGAGRSVVIFDGEMRAESLRQRLLQLHASNSEADSISLAEQNIRIVSRDALKDSIGSIDTEEGQANINALVPPSTKLVVLDNLSAWTEGGREDSAAWATIKRWLIQKRMEGIAVLLVHHAGKGGQQRGTSAHEDLLDYSIRLSPSSEVDTENGTGFTLEHTKIRDFIPQLRHKFDYTIWTEDNVLLFRCTPSSHHLSTRDATVLQMHRDGKSCKEIGDAVGIDKSTVSRVIKKYEAVVAPSDD